MDFLFIIMLIGLSILAGGQVWAFTGEMSLALVCGGVVLVGLTWIYHRFFRSRKKKRFVGEVDQQIDESDFTVLAPGQFDARERVQKKVIDKTPRVAGTIRAMLKEEAGKTSGEKKGK